MDTSEILQKANRQLAQENQALKSAMNQRATDIAIQTVEGLGVLLDEASNGNARAKLVLDRLSERLDQARALKSGLIVAGRVNGSES